MEFCLNDLSSDISLKQVALAGVPIHPLTKSETFQQVIQWFLKRDHSHHLVTLNANMLMMTLRHSGLWQAIGRADLVTVDGVGIQRALNKTGYINPPRFAGIELVRDLLLWCSQQNRSVYFYGGQLAVIRSLEKIIPIYWPGLKPIVIQDGYGLGMNQFQIKEEICRIRPDLLLVGLGLPQQELFLDQILTALPNTIGIGVGGTFEILAGIKHEAPQLIRRNGWEWLYRMMQDPKRLNRIPDLVRFWYRFLR